MAPMRAVIADPESVDRLVIREVDAPAPGPAEAVVDVHAISLNAGETRRALNAPRAWRPGWDFAGVVRRAAGDGSGPAVGARVVGVVESGAWAEQVAVPTRSLAELPEKVSFDEAATLPVAGLTALRALEKGRGLIGRRVLVTGATGGVGYFAIQLARIGGARVTALVRAADRAGFARDAGADEVILEADLAPESVAGRYDIIVESVGGQVLARCLRVLGPHGVCVTLGASSGDEVTFNFREFFQIGNSVLYGLHIFKDAVDNPLGPDLGRLAGLIAAGTLRATIDRRAPWTEIAAVARDLHQRRFAGKAVLAVGG